MTGIDRRYLRFALRAREAAEWTALNEIILDRELGAETDTRRMKIGDGVTPWNDLLYIGGTGGAQWLVGSGAPDPGLGNNGDFYLRSTNGDVYAKAAGVWGLVANIRGPQGIQGNQGNQGIQGIQGPPGGPTEVITTSGDLTLSAATHRSRLLLHAAGEITCPPTVAAGFVKDDVVEVRRQSGAVTFVAGEDVVLDFNTTLYSAGINALKDVVALKVLDVDTWALIGPLADA